MKSRRLFRLFFRFSVFSALCFSLSCKKETATDYARFPIVLTMTDVSNGVKLTWTKVETSDFIDYTIVRSTNDSIPDLNQISTNPTAVILTRITDPKLTSFIDIRNTATQASRLYYRVFVRLSVRNLASKNVASNLDILDLGGSFSEIIPNNSKDKPRFYLSSSNSVTLLCYDANEDRIVTSAAVLPFISMRLAVASKNGVSEEVAAFSTNTGNVSFFDALTLKSTGTLAFNTGTIITAMAGTTDGFFICVTNESTNNIKVVSIANHTIISQTTINFTYIPFSGSVLHKNPAQREFILRDPTISSSVHISRILYNDQGQIIDGGLMGLAGTTFSTAIPVLRVSQNGDLFLVNNIICNRLLQTKASFTTTTGASYSDLAFAQQGDKIYAWQVGAAIASNVDEYDPTTFKFVRTIPTKLIGFRCFTTDAALVLFSNSNATGRTAVQKIKL
jgi:hypothetical protein